MNSNDHAIKQPSKLVLLDLKSTVFGVSERKDARKIRIHGYLDIRTVSLYLQNNFAVLTRSQCLRTFQAKQLSLSRYKIFGCCSSG